MYSYTKAHWVQCLHIFQEDEEDTADVFTIRKAKESRRAEKEKKMAKFKRNVFWVLISVTIARP